MLANPKYLTHALVSHLLGLDPVRRACPELVRAVETPGPAPRRRRGCSKCGEGHARDRAAQPAVAKLAAAAVAALSTEQKALILRTLKCQELRGFLPGGNGFRATVLARVDP